uniref:Putative alpha-ketoglutarate-dependent dioxygenase ABH6 n=2 Tax=Anthurium amnicola TaxID=1678845 RepID=A0A1D1XI67_9ARAE
MEGIDQFVLSDYAVGSLRTLFYIPNFISTSEESQLLHNINGTPISKWKSLKNRRLQNWGGVVHEKGLLPQDLPPWITKITQRICKQTGLFPSPINHVLINEYLPYQGIMPHQDGPAYFPVVAILSLGSPVVIDFTPHPRLSEDTIHVENMPVKSATIGGSVVNSCTWSDESSCKQVDIRHPSSLLLMPGSLLIFKDDAYVDYLHGIEDSELQSLAKIVNTSEAIKVQDQSTHGRSFELGGQQQCPSIHRTATRVSLTCRLVLKVHRNLFKF